MSIRQKYDWKSLEEILRVAPPPAAGEQRESQFPFSMGGWCLWFMAVTIANMIQDAVVVAHAPLGCAQSARNFFTTFYERHYGQPFLHMPGTALDQMQVIMGGTDELRDAIKEVDRTYHPSLILVHGTCAAGINLDDIEGVIARTQSSVDAKLFPVQAPGFKACWFGEARVNVMETFSGLFDPPKSIDPKAVNILGSYKELYSGPGHKRQWQPQSPTDTHEMARLVEAMGLKVHRALMSGDYEYIRTAPEAAVNTHACVAWGHPMAKVMEQKFGTPWMKHGRTIGVDCTIRWMKELASFMGPDTERQAGKVIDHEYGQMKDIWERAQKVCKGRAALIEASYVGQLCVTRPLAQVRLALELGMIPYLFNIHPLILKCEEYVVRYFLDDGVECQTLFGPHPWQEPIAVTEVMAELGLGDDDVVYFPNDLFNYDKAGTFDPSNAARFDGGQPFRRLRGCNRGDGFRGSAGIARDLITAIEGSARKNRPTFYGRLYGQSFEFEEDSGHGPNKPGCAHGGGGHAAHS